MTTVLEEQPQVDLSKKIFTTGEVARILDVSQQTVIREFDRGWLTGFKVPGSKFRRIPRKELIAYMIREKLPLGQFLSEAARVQIYSKGAAPAELMKGDLVGAGDVPLGVALYNNPFSMIANLCTVPKPTPIVCLSPDEEQRELLAALADLQVEGKIHSPIVLFNDGSLPVHRPQESWFPWNAQGIAAAIRTLASMK